jgi:putative serine protease PepD
MNGRNRWRRQWRAGVTGTPVGGGTSAARAFACLGVLALSALVLDACSSSPGQGTASGSGSGSACAATSVATEALPSVVTIAVNGSTATSGSGEVIRNDGYVLTNNHVVSPAAQAGTIQVLLSDGRSYAATITGRDPQTDLAVIKLTTPPSLRPIRFGSSGAVRIGQPVVALGAPLGLPNSVTSGIVSSLDRTIQVPSDNGQTATLLAAIQTDAAINPGNSGGALTNCAGELVGVPTANATVTTSSGQTSTGNVGINFAIPVDLAKGVADELIATGSVTHSFIGLTVSALPPAPDGSATQGLYVSAVAPGGPAAQAGLKAGDVITEIDGAAIHDPTQLALLTLKKKPGETVSLTYERSGTSATATVTLGSPPA